MTKNTRSPMMRVASVMLVLALALSCVVCGTMAKYTSSTSGSDTATVARWSFEVNDAQFATNDPQTLTFELFKTINEADTTTAEDSVSKTSQLIAPGTGGSFQITVENLSQVDATYNLKLEETNAAGIPIQYSLNSETWTDDLSEINGKYNQELDIAKETGTDTLTVYWRWCFEGTESGAHVGQTDAADTALGIMGQTTAPTITIAATLVATQVD